MSTQWKADHNAVDTDITHCSNSVSTCICRNGGREEGTRLNPSFISSISKIQCCLALLRNYPHSLTDHSDIICLAYLAKGCLNLSVWLLRPEKCKGFKFCRFKNTHSAKESMSKSLQCPVKSISELSNPRWSTTREHFHVADDSALTMDLMSAGIFESQMAPKATSAALSIAALTQPRWKEKSCKCICRSLKILKCKWKNVYTINYKRHISS